MDDSLKDLFDFLKEKDGINDKALLSKLVADRFHLVKSRSVFYGEVFAIRFSASNNSGFSNTVLSLSNLRKFDDKPFIVCLVTPSVNHIFLANSSFVKKISHSSQQLREGNIRGSFNGSDIVREFEGISNCSENFARLFPIHAGIGFDGNILRLVESTNNISPSGKKFEITDSLFKQILDAPRRAQEFIESREAALLNEELDQKVQRFREEILLAAHIENVNVRGRIIEYLIAGKDEDLKLQLIEALRSGNKGIPQFKTENSLGDHTRVFDTYVVETDVKTKILSLGSNPKGYNLDKMLEFLSLKDSVFMFYFVGIDPNKVIRPLFASLFQEQILRSTILLKHWSGRNSRGVSQFDGKAISQLILKPEVNIDLEVSVEFLRKVVTL